MPNESLIPTDKLRKLEQGLEKKTDLRSRVKHQASQKTTFVLLDCSGSMNDTLEDGLTRKIDSLRQISNRLTHEVQCPQYAFFDERVVEVQSEVPDPMGGTPLSKAMDFVIVRGATRIIIISDGVPDSKSHCEELAIQFPGKIDVFYVGRDGDAGSQWLRKLAALSKGGAYAPSNLEEPELITSGIKGLLEAPSEPEKKGPIQL